MAASTNFIIFKFIIMKQIKNWLFASAFVFALAGAFAFSMPASNAKTFTTYHYDSDSYELEDMQNIELWKESGPSCDVDGDLPCTINFVGNREAFITFLAESDESEILTAANAKRTVAP